jgi:hypothetical protein
MARAICVGVILVAILVRICSCSNPESAQPGKDPRTYTWSIDTIRSPRGFQMLLMDLWGSSPRDIYAVGSSGDPQTIMIHFDGTSWVPVLLNAGVGGVVEGLDELTSVQGFSAVSIFVVGSKLNSKIVPTGTIVRYDGSSWKEELIDSVGPLQSLWGTSPDDLWAGGIHTLLHRQNGTWKKVQFPALTNKVQFLRITGSSPSNVFMAGVSNGPASPYMYDQRIDLYHYDGSVLSIIDSQFVRPGEPPDHFGTEIRYIRSVLFSGGHGVFMRTGDAWQRILASPYPITRIAGRWDSDLFAVGGGSIILHYDGSSWYQYGFPMPDIPLVSAWVYDDGIYVVGYDGIKSYILHGR